MASHSARRAEHVEPVRYGAAMATSAAAITRLIDEVTHELAAGATDIASTVVAVRNDEALLWMTATGRDDASAEDTARLLGLGAPLALADCLVYGADADALADGATEHAIVTIVIVIDGRRALPTVQLHPYELTRRLGRTRRRLGTPVVVGEDDGGFADVVQALAGSIDRYGDDSFRLAAAQQLIEASIELQLAETLDRELDDLMGER